MKRILLGLLGLGAIIVILKWGRVEELSAFDAWKCDLARMIEDVNKSKGRMGSRF